MDRQFPVREITALPEHMFCIAAPVCFSFCVFLAVMACRRNRDGVCVYSIDVAMVLPFVWVLSTIVMNTCGWFDCGSV